VSGLLLMLTTVLHPVMEPMDGRGFALFLHQSRRPRGRSCPTRLLTALVLLLA